MAISLTLIGIALANRSGSDNDKAKVEAPQNTRAVP